MEANKDFHRIDGNFQTTPIGGGGTKGSSYNPVYTEPTTTRSRWDNHYGSSRTSRPSSTNNRWPETTKRWPDPDYNKPATPWQPMTPFPTDEYETNDDFPTPPWPKYTRPPKRTTTIATTTTTTTTTLPPSKCMESVIVNYPQYMIKVYLVSMSYKP